jgi:hypothetical protein
MSIVNQGSQIALLGVKRLRSCLERYKFDIGDVEPSGELEGICKKVN